MITAYKNRTRTPGEQHRVHRNLADRDGSQIWSILAKRRGRWLVVAHADFVSLADVQFLVQQGGHLRALLTGQRNVHAFAVGRLLTQGEKFWTNTQVRYNPWRAPTFTDEHDNPIVDASHAFFDPAGRVWIQGCDSGCDKCR
jgi:hypothetical protein